MRLFTAIELGEEVCARAGALVSELSARARRSAPHAKLTWVTPDRMHLTLRFIGEVEDARAERILGALRDPFGASPFDVTWSGLGAFPPKGPPRVLWIGVRAGRDELVQLESLVSDRLAPLDIPREARPYSPHLTLARVREAGGLRTAGLFDGLDGSVGDTRVEAITLFRSHLSPKGPTYVALQRTPLRAG